MKNIRPVFLSVCFFTQFAVLLLFFSCASRPSKHDWALKPQKTSTIEEFIPLWERYGPGISLLNGKIGHPRLEFWAIKVDLSCPELEIVVNDENLKSVTVSGFAKRYGCAAAINAGPFAPVSGREGEERTLTGIFVADGRLVNQADSRYDAIIFFEDGTARILRQAEIDAFDGVLHALGGFYIALENGKVPEAIIARAPDRHPRSAVGVAKDGGELYLLVIDGRRLGSAGATEAECGLILKRLGADGGLLLDCGGSSALALDINGKIRTLNKPVHNGIAGRERAVATCIGVRYIN
jgi:exopolysaccharide biosynthesis protein